MREFYIPRHVHAQLLRPYGARQSISCHQLKLPEVLGSERIIFTAVDRPKNSNYRHFAKQGYMGVQLDAGVILLVKESDISFEIPSDFEALRAEAEDELEDELVELSWSPF